jgi:hypothetical protein
LDAELAPRLLAEGGRQADRRDRRHQPLCHPMPEFAGIGMRLAE